MEGGAIGVNDGDNQDELLNLPPGFRFHPTDEEIITHYLSQKVVNSSFTATAIGEVDLNKCEPWDLPKKAKLGEKEWFFFCQKDRKYPTGMRTNRATESGYWKATGKDKEIYSKGKDRHQLIGMKKTLVFYKGRAPKGEKSNWVMHEFRLEGKFSYYNFPKSPKDEWVVCRVVHKNTGTIKTSPTRDLTSINSFVDGLLDTSSLPPLTDSPYFNNNERPNDSTYTKINGNNTEDDFKGTVLANPSMNPITYYQTAPTTNYKVPNSILYQNAIRYQATSSTVVGYPHQQRIINSIPNILGSANSMQTANQALERQLKVEQFSSNQSIVSRSQDTGLSTDMTTEISSKQEVDEGNQYQDLDSFWSY